MVTYNLHGLNILKNSLKLAKICQESKIKNALNNFSKNRDVLSELPILKKYLEFKIDSKYKYLNSWFNYNEFGEAHHRHRHIEGDLTGCFYIQTNLNDCITFYDDNFKEYDVPVYDGLVILFDSKIWHKVKQNKYKNTRISLCFDYINTLEKYNGINISNKSN